MYKYRRYIFLGLIVLLLIAAAAYYFNRPATVTITADEGAKLFVSTDRNGDLEEVGTTSGSFKTSKLPADVYIQAVKDDKKTLSSVHLERGKNQSITLTLAQTKQAQKVTDGSVINAFIEGNLVQGIIAGDQSLQSFTIDTFQPARPEFVSLPYVKKAIWYDRDNFVYLTFDASVGQFKNSQNLGTKAIGESISATVPFQNKVSEDDVNIQLVDIARYPNKPLVLLSKNNIFTSTDMGSRLNAIVNYDNQAHENTVYATATSIFRSSLDQGGDKKGEVAKSSITEYDYTGKEIRNFDINTDSDVVNIVKRGDTAYVLTQASLFTISASNEVTRQGLYFGSAKDMINYNDQVILLGNDGIWGLGKDGHSLQLITSFTQYGIGLEHSMSIMQDGRLLFGTAPRDNVPSDKSAMFAIQL